MIGTIYIAYILIAVMNTWYRGLKSNGTKTYVSEVTV